MSSLVERQKHIVEDRRVVRLAADSISISVAALLEALPEEIRERVAAMVESDLANIKSMYQTRRQGKESK